MHGRRGLCEEDEEECQGVEGQTEGWELNVNSITCVSFEILILFLLGRGRSESGEGEVEC